MNILEWTIHTEHWTLHIDVEAAGSYLLFFIALSWFVLVQDLLVISAGIWCLEYFCGCDFRAYWKVYNHIRKQRLFRVLPKFKKD